MTVVEVPNCFLIRLETVLKELIFDAVKPVQKPIGSRGDATIVVLPDGHFVRIKVSRLCPRITVDVSFGQRRLDFLEGNDYCRDS